MLLIKIKKIFHRGDFQIGLFFDFDENLKNKAKSIGAHWSQTHKCWYVLYNKENYQQILRNFDRIEIIRDKNNQRHYEPAVIWHEIVHIAETISELQLYSKAENKGIIPEIAAKLFFRIKIKIRIGQNKGCEIHRQLDRLVP